jgi:hypothetical protein
VDEESRRRDEAVAALVACCCCGSSILLCLAEDSYRGQEPHEARQARPLAPGDGEVGVKLGERRGAAAAAHGVGDPELDRAVQRHGFEVAVRVTPEPGLGFQDLGRGRR